MHEKNKESILSDNLMFGLSWIGDGATIKHVPLMNMLAVCGNVAPVVVSICDSKSLVKRKIQNSLWITSVRKWMRGTLTNCFF